MVGCLGSLIFSEGKHSFREGCDTPRSRHQTVQGRLLVSGPSWRSREVVKDGKGS